MRPANKKTIENLYLHVLFMNLENLQSSNVFVISFSVITFIVIIVIFCRIIVARCFIEIMRDKKWRRINSVAKGKVMREEQCIKTRTFALVYDQLCKYEREWVFEQAQRRGICLDPRRRRIPSACLINDTSLTMERRNFL